MSQFLPILTNTPKWVWVVLVLLLWLGIQGLKPRAVALPRIFITPAVFITWGIVALAARSTPAILLDWAATVTCGIGLALVTIRLEGLRVDRERSLVHLPRSVGSADGLVTIARSVAADPASLIVASALID